ncbi:ABC transporter permease [Thermostaphylospora chromogena]|uniref:Peptide/nickel transport system permease protein n=1 Tax=Thermostaphylospora chromogena TaxID=35622 RepID=A0A1H1HK72_9ACTN|nr:ABC transporter permease [Thermostaphylospora chromogena]SDR25787.1 peptide/nickel transport system permease protein [Thermostaphylospora chromogena]
MTQSDQVSPSAETGAAQPAGLGPSPSPGAKRRGGDTLHFALRNKKLVGGSIVVLALLILGVVGPMVYTASPVDYTGLPAQQPFGEYPLGTTMSGQDVLAQFLHGVRATFIVGLLGGGLAALVGMTVGFLAGYRGGIVDEILNMFTNILLVIPTLAVLIILAAYLQVRGVLAEALFIGLTSWPWAARAVRSQTLSLAARDFVDLARLSGVRTWKIIVREIAPNMSSYLFMTFILLFGGAVLSAATLDFIGLGPTDSMSLGLMLNNAVKWSALQLGMWWWFVPPGLGITAVVGSLYVMNVGLDEVFNPRLREM